MSVDSGVDDFDYGTFGQGPEEPSAETGSESQNAATVTEGEPAESGETVPGHFAEITDRLPAEFRGGVIEGLRKMDQNATKMAEKIHAKYAGYKDFVDNGIEPAVVAQGLQFIDTLNQNPVALLENLKQMLIDQGMYAEAQQVEDKQQEIVDENSPNPTTEDPRVAALENSLRNVEARFQAEEEAKFNHQIEQQIDGEYAYLESRLGKPLTEAHKKELALRAVALSQASGKQVSIVEAHQDLERVRRQFQMQSAANGAPRVPSGAGSAGTPAGQPPVLATKEDRAAAAAAIIARSQVQ